MESRRRRTCWRICTRSLAESTRQHERSVVEYGRQHERALAELAAEHRRLTEELGMFSQKRHEVYARLYARYREADDRARVVEIATFWSLPLIIRLGFVGSIHMS